MMEHTASDGYTVAMLRTALWKLAAQWPEKPILLPDGRPLGKIVVDDQGTVCFLPYTECGSVMLQRDLFVDKEQP